MEREPLERFLAAGLSLEEIGRRVGRDHSTVGYWIKKHGLQAVHRDQYAPKGGLPKEALIRLIDEELTLREMGERLGVSIATVRYWLKRHDIAGLRHRIERPVGERPVESMRACPKHGLTRFVLENRGYYRCARCRLEGVSEWRRRKKALLVAEAGGRCLLCGYDRYLGALQFHHLDPQQKRFALSLRGVTRSFAVIRAEAQKCALLCANCHAEVEAGVTELDAKPFARHT